MATSPSGSAGDIASGEAQAMEGFDRETSFGYDVSKRERWGGWNGKPYTTTSWRHVSVYERATI
jgi:hypothetical protein